MVLFIGLRRRYRLMKRYRQIMQALAGHGFSHMFGQSGLAGLIALPRRVAGHPPREILERSAPERVRLVLEELGPAFIKLGQILSTQGDILPREYIEQLEKLQDDVPPVPVAEITRVIESELGQPLATLFADFELEPLAAASIAQVHRATMPDGTDIVIKVQRPGVKEQIDLDLQILQDFARLADRHTPWGRIHNFTEMAAEFRETITEETDFRIEARYADTIRRNLEGDPRVHIPQVQWTHTTQQVLTLEYVEGIKLSNLPALEAAGMDRARLARTLADVMLKQLLIDGIFHADPHPGNISALPGERLAFVDFGITGRLHPDHKENLGQIMLGLIRKNADMVVRAVLRTGAVPGAVDRFELRRDIERLQQKYYDVPLNQINITESMQDFLVLAHRHRVRLPAEMTLLIKAMITTDGVVRQLDPEISIVEVAKPLGQRLMAERFGPARLRRLWQENLPEYVHIASQLPLQMHDIFDQLSRGDLHIKQENPGLDRLSRNISALADRIILAMLVIVLFLGAGLFAHQGYHLFGALAVADLSLIAGTMLGVWLIFKIIRSGRL